MLHCREQVHWSRYLSSTYVSRESLICGRNMKTFTLLSSKQTVSKFLLTAELSYSDARVCAQGSLSVSAWFIIPAVFHSLSLSQVPQTAFSTYRFHVHGMLHRVVWYLLTDVPWNSVPPFQSQKIKPSEQQTIRCVLLVPCYLHG